MQPKIKLGLIVGVIGLVLNICVSGFIGVCGTGVSLLAGAVAGFLTGQQEKAASKGDGARAGATSGAIAGGLIIIGQILGGIAALAYFQFSGTQLPFGQVPPPSADPSQQIVYYLGGFGTGLCIGLIGLALAALAGAGTGYLGTPDRPQNMSQPTIK